MVIERTIFCEITIPATIPEVWQAWTTESGAESFFSRKCKIDLLPGGAYEMLFNQDPKPGEQEYGILAVFLPTGWSVLCF
jgi:uncharacterized protein YndB with AHSA1/START domain